MAARGDRQHSSTRFAGARAGFQWHGILSEMGMVVVSSTIAVGDIGNAFDDAGEPAGDHAGALTHALSRLADDLAWWAEAARAQRARSDPPY